MKGGIYERPECCNQPCECPVCLENKPLMRLNCGHYVCLEDIQRIINSNPRRLQRCPICRDRIDNYGCNGNIINVGNNQPLNMNHYEEEGDTDNEDADDEGYLSDDTVERGGKRKKHVKLNKRKITNRSSRKRKITNRSSRKRKINKRKTKRWGFKP